MEHWSDLILECPCFLKIRYIRSAKTAEYNGWAYFSMRQHVDEEQKPNTNLVVRSRDPDKLAAAMAAVKEMLAGLNITR